MQRDPFENLLHVPEIIYQVQADNVIESSVQFEIVRVGVDKA